MVAAQKIEETFTIAPHPRCEHRRDEGLRRRDATGLASLLPPSGLTVVGCWASVATSSWHRVVHQRALSSSPDPRAAASEQRMPDNLREEHT